MFVLEPLRRFSSGCPLYRDTWSYSDHIQILGDDSSNNSCWSSKKNNWRPSIWYNICWCSMLCF